MEKRNKTDYLEKIKLLAEICNENISCAKKILSAEQLPSGKTTDSGEKILEEIKSSLSKDYFTPFEREDIFILCEKLNELSENSQNLCTYASEADIFGLHSNVISLTYYLKNITDLLVNTLTQLSKYPKQGDLTAFLTKVDTLLNKFKKQFYSSLMRSNNNTFCLILYITEKCADNCKEINQLIQYTLIKNS